MPGPGDTRRYNLSYVHSDFDFDGACGFDTSLHFSVPINQYGGHDVIYGHRRFELWSPNSLQLPGYPGTRPAQFSLVPPLAHRRVDGSGGRFDWTLVPQALDPNFLHHPFILNPEFIKHPLPEFTYLTSVWVSSVGSKGHLQPDFYSSLLSRAEELETYRLRALPCVPVDLNYLSTLVSEAPTLVDIHTFAHDMLWDVCVERVTHIQRLLREKDGWLRMMRALRSTHWSMGDPIAIRDSGIVKADDQYLGAWVNGSNERIVMWLLQLGVPCFIIHEYREGVDYGHGIPERRNRDCTKSFFPCVIWHLRGDVNAYDAVARRQTITWLSDPPLPSNGPNIRASSEALARSSSHSHGYSRPLEKQLPITHEDGDIVWLSSLPFPNRIPWIKPPSIIAADKAGSWSRFSITSLDVGEDHPLYGHDVMQERGHKFTGEFNLIGPYYDRQNKRQLYFDSLPIVKGLVSDVAFGRPVPFYNFVGPS
jgi:hypothetical protein